MPKLHCYCQSTWYFKCIIEKNIGINQQTNVVCDWVSDQKKVLGDEAIIKSKRVVKRKTINKFLLKIQYKWRMKLETVLLLIFHELNQMFQRSSRKIVLIFMINLLS